MCACLPVKQEDAAVGFGEEDKDEDEGRMSSFALRYRWKSGIMYCFIAFLLAVGKIRVGRQ